MSVTEKDVLNALSHVDDPDLKKDLVTLNMVKNIKISGVHIEFEVVLTTPACPLKEAIREACITAVKHFCGQDKEVTPIMTAQVTSQRKGPHEILPGVRNVIAVGAGKGGVGKSTVATNLAIALSQTGAKVGLLDADIYGPSIPTLLSLVDQSPYMQEIDGEKKMLPLDRFGIEVMSIGFLFPAKMALPYRGPMTSKILLQLINDTAWDELDYLVVDMPPGTGDVHITIAQQLPVSGVVLVTTPQEVAVADTRKAFHMFTAPSINIPVIGVVENMAYFTPDELPDKKYYLFGKEGGRKLAEEVGIPLLAEFPMQEIIQEASDAGEPIALNPEHPVGKMYAIFAQKVAQTLAVRNAALKTT